MVLDDNAIDEETDVALDEVDAYAEELDDETVLGVEAVEDKDEEATEELVDDEACDDDDDCEFSELLLMNKDGAVELEGLEELTEEVAAIHAVPPAEM